MKKFSLNKLAVIAVSTSVFLSGLTAMAQQVLPAQTQTNQFVHGLPASLQLPVSQGFARGFSHNNLNRNMCQDEIEQMTMRIQGAAANSVYARMLRVEAIFRATMSRSLDNARSNLPEILARVTQSHPGNGVTLDRRLFREINSAPSVVEMIRAYENRATEASFLGASANLEVLINSSAPTTDSVDLRATSSASFVANIDQQNTTFGMGCYTQFLSGGNSAGSRCELYNINSRPLDHIARDLVNAQSNCMEIMNNARTDGGTGGGGSGIVDHAAKSGDAAAAE